MDDTSKGDHGSFCECQHDSKRTGTISIEDTLLKVALLVSERDELAKLLGELVGYVDNLSQTGWLQVINLLVESGHVEAAGLVRHFMANAMSTYMGGD